MPRTTTAMETSSTGMTTASSQERPASSRIAITTPPTIIIGTITASVQVSTASIWTCWTSFVVRVISDGAPKRPTSRALKEPTLAKIAARRSRPKLIELRAAK